MTTVVVDGGLMTSREAAHDLLAARLGLPEYYGRNLDALYDALTERAEPTRLVLLHREELATRTARTRPWRSCTRSREAPASAAA